MAEVLSFKPKHELEYEKNQVDFIALGRQIAPLNDKYVYDENYWSEVGNFTVFGANSRQKNPEDLLIESLIPFAKAYVTYGGGTKAGISVKFQALRAINTAWQRLHKGEDFDTSKLTSKIFDAAQSAAKESLSAGSAYQTGRGLNNLLKFLINYKLLKPFTWKSGLKKPAVNATGDDADKRRQDKMPDENALMALASVNAQKTEDLSPRDIFTTSTMTLLLAAPNRGSEPLYLLSDPIHTDELKVWEVLKMDGFSRDDVKAILEYQKEFDSNPAVTENAVFDKPGSVIKDSQKMELDKDELDLNAVIRVKGLKWYSGKDFGHAHKWIPSCMYGVVEAAIARLQKQSEPARKFAKLLEDIPDFPRHDLCPDVPEDQPLTMDEVAMALGLDLSDYGDISDKENRKKWHSSRHSLLKRKGVERKDYVVTLRELNAILRNDLPEGFPYIPFKKGNGHVKVKWSEALYAGFANCFSTQKLTIPTELYIPSINALNEDLEPTRKKSRKTGELLTGTPSVFQRWGHGDFKITSHQMRHMLDTMAAVNGMESEQRANWAMRSDPRHNRYYDHTTPEEYGADFIEDQEADLASKGLISNPATGTTQIQVQIATPRTLQELNTKAALTAHTNEFGMCVTSYMAEPCTKYRDCINCDQQVCEKGDDGKCERIRTRLKDEKRLLKMDKKAVDDGIQGARQFYERRKLTTERCEQLLAMMEDPNIEDGSLIKLVNLEDVTQLDRAMDANGKKRLPKIENFQRIKANQRVSVTVDEMIGIESNSKLDNDDELFEAMDDLDCIDFFED
ncbi:integrase [Photobacterium damselae subsp. damselae]|uniref:integrase n=1 Tax=Photobacterium damselae TaxID=38293 RepID=UPI000D05075D|nr:integrase [Photobacterium damselae]PSB79107.1 integrase [Photobacterium damselae subsp. damselae]PSB84000.1 integrase [Photobacterium damselae subsp. damselae]